MNPEKLQDFLNERLSDDEMHYDSQDTGILFRKLEAVKDKTYDVKYPAFKSRNFIPSDGQVDPAAQTIVYGQWDQFGMAKVVANYATDFPRVDVIAKEFRTPVESVGDSYGYSVMDLRRSRMAGSPPLDQKRADVARRAIESTLDRIAAYGHESGIPGFLTNDNVPESALTLGNWIGGNRTATQMLQDLHDLVAASVDAGGEVFEPDTIILPTREYARIAQTFMDTTNTQSVLQAFLGSNPYIKNVDHWHRLNTVPVSPGVTRKLVVCYTRSTEVLTLEEPQPFEQFPPQAKGMSFEVYCHARTGGTVIRYPLAVRYGTGI